MIPVPVGDERDVERDECVRVRAPVAAQVHDPAARTGSVIRRMPSSSMTTVLWPSHVSRTQGP